jgi:glyoxylase-like metal-dependent hydrolase (beta-lactamase superfamily II)
VTITAFVTGIFEENCYVVADDATGDAAIVDPGADGDDLVAAIGALGVRPRAVWLTHAHIDHIGAVTEVRRAWSVPVFLHPADLPLYRAGDRQAAAYGIAFEPPPDPDASFADGMPVRLGELTFEVMHAPGHAPGHVVLHGHGVAFVGDCLFAGSVGRTDLPLADGRELARSLSRITALPAATRVLPGHGPETTIGRELATNPFLVGPRPGSSLGQ